MPSGKPGSGTKLGDNCRDCGFPIFSDNALFKGTHLQSRCKTCHFEYSNNLPSRSKESRQNNWLSWKFGMTKEEYQKKVDLQLGGCAICKQPCASGKNLAVDHNHTTNVIRDLLCYRCNTVLGLMNEDEDLLIDMIEYLKKHGQKIA